MQVYFLSAVLGFVLQMKKWWCREVDISLYLLHSRASPSRWEANIVAVPLCFLSKPPRSLSLNFQSVKVSWRFLEIISPSSTLVYSSYFRIVPMQNGKTAWPHADANLATLKKSHEKFASLAWEMSLCLVSRHLFNKTLSFKDEVWLSPSFPTLIRKGASRFTEEPFLAEWLKNTRHSKCRLNQKLLLKWNQKAEMNTTAWCKPLCHVCDTSNVSYH